MSGIHPFLLLEDLSRTPASVLITNDRPERGWDGHFHTFQCIFVHLDLDLPLLFVGMRERSRFCLGRRDEERM